MNKNIILLTLIGLIGLFSNCEKDGTQVTISKNPIVPTITSMSDLTLLRDNGADTLTFIGTPIDLGFNVSATYFLEACAQDNGFVDVTIIYSGVQDTLIQMTNSELNGILLNGFPEDQTSSVDFRIRAALVVDGGQGAPGTGDDLMEYNSETTTDNVTIYGFPALYITGDANDQRLVSADNDSIYTGWVYSDGTAFTLTNRDNSKVYGATGSDVSEGGAAISLAVGVHNITINLKTLNLSSSPEEWGIIGSAIPPYDWSADVNMDFDLDGQFWAVTGDFIQGEYKFRANDDWALNLGDNGPDGNLEEGGSNIELAAAGNYTIKLYHSRTYSTVGN